MTAMLLQRCTGGNVAAGVSTIRQQRAAPPHVQNIWSVVRAGSLESSSHRSLQRLVAGKRVQAASRRSAVILRADAGHSPPPVSDTKRAFLEAYPRPLPGIYDTVIQELLVQQHLIRFQKKYSYDPVGALGFVSVFDQIMEGLPADEQKAVLSAFAGALKEDPEQYRKDASSLEEWARSASVDELKPDASGSGAQTALAGIAERAASGNIVYSKFLAIGLFRLLELVGAKDPKALENLVKSINLRPELVNRDLLTYKGVLSKLSAAKELMKEIIARERKKQQQRADDKVEAAKAKAAEGKIDSTAAKVEEAVEA